MGRKLIIGAAAGIALIVAALMAFVGLAVSLSPPAIACDQSDNVIVASDLSLGSGPASRAFFAQFPASVQAEQKKYASMIISIGQQRGRSVHDIQVILGAAIQESKLQNLPYGDRDSINLFQMRPSVMGGDGKPYWGTASQLMDPTYAINRIYKELEGVQNREGQSVIDLAIKIERPDPQYYHANWKWDPVVADLTNEIRATPAQPANGSVVEAAAMGSCSTGATSGSNIRGDDYPYKAMPNIPGSPFGYYYRECVDFVAWRLNEQSGITHPPFKFGGLGNANTWKDNLTNLGYKADHTPAVDAVAWWGPNVGTGSVRAGELGHVAIVSEVKTEGSIVTSITVEQYNVLPFADHAYNKMEIPASYLQNLVFIHVTDVPHQTS